MMLELIDTQNNENYFFVFAFAPKIGSVEK